MIRSISEVARIDLGGTKIFEVVESFELGGDLRRREE